MEDARKRSEAPGPGGRRCEPPGRDFILVDADRRREAPPSVYFTKSPQLPGRSRRRGRRRRRERVGRWRMRLVHARSRRTGKGRAGEGPAGEGRAGVWGVWGEQPRRTGVRRRAGGARRCWPAPGGGLRGPPSFSAPEPPPLSPQIRCVLQVLRTQC